MVNAEVARSLNGKMSLIADICSMIPERTDAKCEAVQPVIITAAIREARYKGVGGKILEALDRAWPCVQSNLTHRYERKRETAEKRVVV